MSLNWASRPHELAFPPITGERLRESKVWAKRGMGVKGEAGAEDTHIVRVHAYSRERTRRQGQAGCRQEFDFGCRPP